MERICPGHSAADRRSFWLQAQKDRHLNGVFAAQKHCYRELQQLRLRGCLSDTLRRICISALVCSLGGKAGGCAAGCLGLRTVVADYRPGQLVPDEAVENAGTLIIVEHQSTASSEFMIPLDPATPVGAVARLAARPLHFLLSDPSAASLSRLFWSPQWQGIHYDRRYGPGVRRDSGPSSPATYRAADIPVAHRLRHSRAGRVQVWEGHGQTCRRRATHQGLACHPRSSSPRRSRQLPRWVRGLVR